MTYRFTRLTLAFTRQLDRVYKKLANKKYKYWTPDGKLRYVCYVEVLNKH